MAFALVLAGSVAIIPLARAQAVDAQLWIPNGTVRTLAIDGNILYLGGEFTQLSPPPGSDPSFAPVARIGVAAIDLTTGVPTDWAPGFAYAYVRKVVVAESTVYLAGVFGPIAGQSRYQLVELLKSSGEPTEWNPIVDDAVFDLAVTDSTVFIGGQFDLVGEQRRWYVAEVSRSSGLPTSWGEGQPPSAYKTMQVCLHGNVLYSGGYYSDLHAFDAHTGVELPGPAPGSGTIWALTAGAGLLYVGGGGSEGVPRRLEAIDLVSGEPTEWQPLPRYGPVRALALAPDRMYVGGDFLYFGNYEKRYLAAVDLETGAVLPTDIALNLGSIDGVYSIVLHGGHVYVGGRFTTAAEPSRGNLVGFEDLVVLGVGQPESQSQAWRLSVRPNPLAQHGSVRLTLARSETVSLSVYDLGGRERIRLMEGQTLEAGPHDFSLSAKRLEPGVYFVRLQAGDRRQSAPFVVRQ